MKYTLLVLAAGLGSRFGGFKQLEPVGPNGEFLIDYSIYDAMQAGFERVVFVIRKEHEERFRATIGNRIAEKIEVVYAFQELNDLPSGFSCPKERTKPWGTTHAILAGGKMISGPFAIINADDLYGRDAYQVAIQFLKQSKETYALVGYPVAQTLSSHGSVKRGICHIKDGYLSSLVEAKIERVGNHLEAETLLTNQSVSLEKDTLVSMNLFLLNPSILPYLEEKFTSFLEENQGSLDCECLIPDVINDMIQEGKGMVEVLNTTATWLGMTYQEEKEEIKQTILKMIEEGTYPSSLWN